MRADSIIAKRLFDVALSLILILLLSPLLLVLVVIASIDTHQLGLFFQTRIGKDAKPFSIVKVRTVRGNEYIAVDAIPKVASPFGKFLIKSKLNELPQLFNILKGDMSFVGPRPDVPGYADLLKDDDRVILSVRPGLTGPATLKYRNEQVLLKEQKDPKQYNDAIIWPDKVKVNRAYVENWSFKKDLTYIWKTIFP